MAEWGNGIPLDSYFKIISSNLISVNFVIGFEILFINTYGRKKNSNKFNWWW
jgi:hypothetical protein